MLCLSSTLQLYLKKLKLLILAMLLLKLVASPFQQNYKPSAGSKLF